MGMEISKTFPDGRGSVKWAEMQETNYTTHFWGPDISRKGPMYQYLSNVQKRRNRWKVKEMKMAVHLKLTWSIPLYTQ